jgi:hypothetical protein
MWKSVREFPGALVNALGWIAGIAAAALPKRWWPTLDPYIPVTDSASIAAILTILVAGVIGVPGFISHTTEQVSLNNRVILGGASGRTSRSASGEAASDRDWGQMFVGVSGLSLFTFIFLTPAGWASTYLGISGTWRGIAAAVDEPFGDPILTGLDALILRGTRRTRTHVARYQRESLEGRDVPDRIVRGSQVGVDDAEWVIISARRKPLWDSGTVVDTGERWFRISSIEERTITGRLRTLYGLTEHRDSGAIRRLVLYDMPPDWEQRAADERHDSAH